MFLTSDTLEGNSVTDRQMKNNPLPRLDDVPEIRERLLPFCRLAPGEIWADQLGRHRIGCYDAADHGETTRLLDGDLATLAIHDPPYNVAAFEIRGIAEFISWCSMWLRNTTEALADDAAQLRHAVSRRHDRQGGVRTGIAELWSDAGDCGSRRRS